MCVGYSVHFPFIKHDIFRRLSAVQEIYLYKNTFVPDVQRQTLAIIGCSIGLGGDPPMREMQCRLAARVFKVCTLAHSVSTATGALCSAARMFSECFGGKL